MRRSGSSSSGATKRREAGGDYLRVPAPGGGVGLIVRGSSRELLGDVDAVVFDCDGVLIDARRSYDATIRVVVEMMVKEIAGVRLGLARAIPNLISTMRRTGGFNSDWDTTYALTLFSLVALERRGDGRGARGPGATEELLNITAKFGSARRESGWRAVDSFLESEFPPLEESLDRAREYLGYPGVPPEGRMTTAFDELYFGASLFEKFHGVPAKNARARGLIELERVLVKRETLESLAKMVGHARLAMVTGRPYLGTEHSLGKRFMGYFDKGSSMFIGDSDMHPELRAEYDRYRKPSPEALLRASEKLSSARLLYVGDSAEDLLMVQNLKRRGRADFLFAGVYGMSPDVADQVAFFEREGSDVIVRSVNQLPSGLLLPPSDEVTREG
jgi:phosphoglycolate phosphatase-like HAD superfamily hydrolase